MTVLRGKPNILSLMEVVIDPRTSIVSLVTEYIERMKWPNLIRFAKMTEIKHYMYRLLQALDVTHKNGIMHRDVKQANILCEDPHGTLKLSDWGVAEFYHPLRKYSCKVGTLSYKAPELLSFFGFYDFGVDIWAAGCVFLGMLVKKKQVFSGKTDFEVLREVARIVGGRAIADWMRKFKLPVEPFMIESMEAITGQGFESLFGVDRRPFMDEQALDLVKRMLTVDHKERISAAEALQHQFFAEVRDL